MFLSRLSKDGISNSVYFSRGWVSNQDGLQMPNCTYYAYGRSNELAKVNVGTDNKIFNRNGFGDAKSWYKDAHWSVGAKPKLGAICCWGSDSDQYGHVAIVEEVINDTTVKVSQSNHGGAYFEVKTYTCEVGKVTSGVGYVFNGYIYNPYITDERTIRDESKTQVKVKADSLKARNEDGTWDGLFVPKGIYNVDSFFEKDGYKWAKIGDVIFATNDKEEWTETYEKGGFDELKEALDKIYRTIQEKDDKISKLSSALDSIKEIVNSI